MGSARQPHLARLSLWSARHPLGVLAAAALILSLAAFSLSRTTVASSLQAMLGNDAPSAAALARIAADYRALDELLVLATLPADHPAGAAGLERLTTYADRLERAVTADATAAPMTLGVRFRRDPAYDAIARDLILPAGAFYLSDAGFEEFLRRLTPEGMREQIARNEALVAAPGPAADAIGRALLRDPLRLTDLIEDRAASLGPLHSSQEDAAPPPELSTDGRTLLIRIAGVRPVDDLPFAQSFTDQIARLARDANTDALQIDLAGGYAIAATTSRSIRSDSITSIVISVTLLHLLFIAFYRRIGAPLLIGGVAAAGIVAGFGAHAAAVPTITPLTAVIAAMLAGLGVDYGIHFLSHYEVHRAAGLAAPDAAAATSGSLGVPIVTNCFTSILGFASLWPSRVAMLRDFAVMGALGLLGALVAVFVLMPALLALTDRRPRKPSSRASLSVIADTIAARPRFFIATATTLLALAAVSAAANGWVPRIESDLTVMHPRPNRPLELTNTLAERFTSHGETIPVELRADSPGALLASAHDAAAALATPAARAAGITDVLGINTLLPDPRITSSRRDTLESIDPAAVSASFDAALQSSIFDPAPFAAYRDVLTQLVTARQAPSLPDLLAYPSIAGQILPASSLSADVPPTTTLLLVRLDHSLSERTDRDAAVRTVREALADIPGATPTGLSVVAHDLEGATRADLPQAVALSIGLVFTWLLIVFRRVADVLLALVPLLFAALCTVGFMAATGQRFNPVNGVAIPLMDGIAVDAGVFLVAAARANSASRAKLARAFRSTGHAVLAASATTVVGFGALYFTNTPAIRSLGLVVSIGITASLIGALFLLMPLLLLRTPTGPGEPRA